MTTHGGRSVISRVCFFIASAYVVSLYSESNGGTFWSTSMAVCFCHLLYARLCRRRLHCVIFFRLCREAARNAQEKTP